MIHSYLKPLPIPVPASLKAMYVYKSKPHDPWDSRQSVHWLLNYDLEHTKKQKSNLTSSHPDLRGGTQVRDNVLDCHKGAAEVEPDGLHDCVNIRGPWNKRDVKKQNTQTEKKHVVHVQAWKLSQMCNSNYRRSKSFQRRHQALVCVRLCKLRPSAVHESPTIKTNALATIYEKIWSVSSRPGQRTVRVKNLLLINENIKQPCTAGQVQTAETLLLGWMIRAGAGRPETRTATPTWYDIENIQISSSLKCVLKFSSLS